MSVAAASGLDPVINLEAHAFGGALGSYGPYLFILLAGWLATDIWRYIGVLSAYNLSQDSEAIRWVKCVATALVAGVIGQLIIFPTGALAATPLILRISALAVGAAGFMIFRRNVLAGILLAEATLLAGWLAFG